MADRMLVSTKKGLFSLARGAAGWAVERVAFLGENVTLAHPAPEGWYAALNLGHFGVKLKFSPDRGRTWEDRAAPAYPDGETIATADGKPSAPATLKQFWAFESGDASQPNRLWAGTLPGGLFRSDDGGRSWELVRGLWDRPERAKWFGGGADFPGIHSICRDPRNARTLRVAVSCGGVWITGDDGATWENVGDGMFAEYMPPELKYDKAAQDPHLMAQCRANPDCLWVQHHNGVFRSTDGGRTFEHVAGAAPTGFGFGVAVHPADGRTAWFVPAVKDQTRVPVGGQLVVSRTRDGGKTFEVLRDGLPQEHCYDLVYRHALAIDETGDRLAIGSTTGGLWASDDQGDHWQTIPARLPPVHAVRFAA
jgi:photosystem II stability/assembly factor-like uncharacterized protein